MDRLRRRRYGPVETTVAHNGAAVSAEFEPYPFAARHYTAHVPQPSDRTERKRVAIVGGGPVGLALALGLANHGVASVVIEADDRVCTGSRAICISRRSLQILQRLSVLAPFLDKGLPWMGGRSFYRETQVLQFAMPHDADQKLPPMINIEQYYVEQFLLDAGERRSDLIDIRWQTRATDITPDGNGATLQLETPAGSYALRADWVVACDGGRSRVREALGLALEGTTYEGRYVIVDVRLRSERPTERLAWFDPPSNPGSTILMHKQPDDIWRIDYQLRDDENADAAVQPENVIPRVASHLAMIGETEPWSPVWIAIYKAHALTLASYRHGRVLFAGDAAHLLPIFGVRGLNSSLEDADNLAWKLALVVKGTAAEQLLDTYSHERVGAARENLRHGTKSTEFMAPPSFAYGLMRQAVLGLAARHARLRSLINPRQTVPTAYSDSPLNIVDAAGGGRTAGPRAGEVLTECPVRIMQDGVVRDAHLTDLLGAGFTALCFTADGAMPAHFAGLEAGLADSGVPFKLVPIGLSAPVPMAAASYVWDHDGRLAALYDATPQCVYLVRPDGYVLARWRKATAADVSAAIAHALRGGRGSGP
jgi:3-(3-hydroxy-phenyl)propionate hydroxylase